MSSLYWSIRRELWENRAVYIAPLVVAAVFLFAFLIHTFARPHRLTSVAQPYNFVAGLICVTAFLAADFYCLDALYGERRDRSILFWKSLPVSDLTTVLSKATIPLVILPAFVFAVVMTAHVMIVAMSTLALLGNEPALAALWASVKFLHSSLALLYALVLMALWYAPIYGWLLMISAWARRAAFLWALLPPMGLMVFERIAFSTHFVYLALGNRMTGWLKNGFVMDPRGRVAALDPLDAMTPLRFFSAPALWTGLAPAVIFFFAAVRLRRSRAPI